MSEPMQRPDDRANAVPEGEAMTTQASESNVSIRRRLQRRPPAAAQPTASGFDRDYWLRHCEGYRVDGVEGRLGFVDSIREGASGEPIIAVRARQAAPARSRARCGLHRAAREAIWLAAPTEIVASEPA
jgi:hypothetical protein